MHLKHVVILTKAVKHDVVLNLSVQATDEYQEMFSCIYFTLYNLYDAGKFFSVTYTKSK
jgi:hypothetical protein